MRVQCSEMFMMTSGCTATLTDEVDEEDAAGAVGEDVATEVDAIRRGKE